MRDLSGQLDDLTPATLDLQTLERLKALDASQLPVVPSTVRLGPCVGQVRNVVAIGLNYADHAAEAGLKPPSQPIVFNKHTGSISGPNDPVWLPPGSQKLDWEVELGVVVGRPAWHVSRDHALSYVAGYCLINDVSERADQMEREGQWVKGKSCDTFAPLGPFLATRDEVADPQNLKLWLKLNGKTIQNSSTAQMIFGVKTLVSYLSQFMSLLPGDIITTGTPPGVGLGFKPEPVFMKPGDVIELGVEGLGVQGQTAVAWGERA
jgi:2-keto-4-pentenoate hydratase/2-oxohepta-3-ene-1,7-dioic acid hydratase in catechol pathway